jgi:hypothetical protein
MCTLRSAVLLFALLLTSLAPSFAQEALLIPRLSGPIQFDGLSDEPAWQEVQPLPMVTLTPTGGLPPSERTEIRIAHDGQFLYVAARMYDSDPNGIRATSLRRNDNSLTNDWLVLSLDTFRDRETTSGFGVTPSGVRTDVIFPDDGQSMPNFDWSTFWDAEVRRTEEGWFVEMRIPFSSLRFQEENGVVRMGMNVWRNIARKNEISTFPAIPAEWGFGGITKASLMHDIRIEGVRSRRPLYATPYVLGGGGYTHAASPVNGAYPRTDQPLRDAGIDLKYGLTSNLTLDLTVNTDFAQAEADDQQVNLTRFSLFFPEKRQFFQERAGVFAFSTGANDRLFYSRRVGLIGGRPVPLLGGARLVGRVGAWDVGLLNMQTGRLDDLPSENLGVARVRRQVINPNSYVGGILTTRYGGTDNLVYGLDGIFRMAGDDYLTANWAQSFTALEQPTGDPMARSLVRLNWERRGTDGLRYGFGVTRVGHVFEPGLGFILRSDYTRLGDRISYGWRPGADSPLQFHSLTMDGSAYFRNADGSLETVAAGPRWDLTLKTGHVFSITATSMLEDLPTGFRIADGVDVPAGTHLFHRGRISYSPSQATLLRTSASLETGTFFDGTQTAGSLSPSWNVSRHLELSGTYILSHIQFAARAQEFTAHLARLRVRAALNTRLSGAAFVQYNSAADAVSLNLRIRYNPREGNDLYLVFNEGLITDRLDADPTRPLFDSRTVMIKYSHTLHL